MSNQKIYTNISVRGDNILFRGYENGRRIHEKIPFRPTLFVPTKKKTNYKTLFGEPVEPFQPGSIGDCREFIDQYSDVKGFSIYGNTDYTYQFISETFPNEMEYDSDDLRVAYFDIETKCEEGFPDVSTANEEVIAITIRIGTKICTFALGKFKELNAEHDARCYSSESRMLEDFLEYWKQLDIDIITG